MMDFFSKPKLNQNQNKSQNQNDTQNEVITYTENTFHEKRRLDNTTLEEKGVSILKSEDKKIVKEYNIVDNDKKIINAYTISNNSKNNGDNHSENPKTMKENEGKRKNQRIIHDDEDFLNDFIVSDYKNTYNTSNTNQKEMKTNQKRIIHDYDDNNSTINKDNNDTESQLTISNIKNKSKSKKANKKTEDNEEFYSKPRKAKGNNNDDNNNDNDTSQRSGLNQNEKNETNQNNDKLFDNPESSLPFFLNSNQIKDKDGYEMTHPLYDPSSLYIPYDFLSKQTPSMQQFWEFKRNNFDKVILFKLGKFYEMFYDDAIIGNQVLGLKWMGNDPNKLHVGFPEVNLLDKSKILVLNGFKVAVIEQTEKAADVKKRQENQESTNKKDKLAKRELTQVLTKGSLVDYEGELYKNNYCVFLSHSVNHDIQNEYEGFGVVVIDLTTNKYLLYSITSDEINNNKMNSKLIKSQELFRHICSLLYKLSPNEVVFLKDNIKPDLINFTNSLSSKPQVSSIKNRFSLLETEGLIKKWFYKNESNRVVFEKVFSDKEINVNNHILLPSIYTSIIYLEKILLAESFFEVCDVKYFLESNLATKNMILDFLTISKLDLIESKHNQSSSGSLNELINKASTSFGKRLISSWLLNPLTEVNEINSRLNTIEIIGNNEILMRNIESRLVKLPDIEKKLNQIYKYSVSTSSKAVYFENVNQKRLLDFMSLLNNLTLTVSILKDAEGFISSDFVDEVNDNNLFIRLILNDENNISVTDQISFLNNLIEESRNEKGELEIVPKEGYFTEYDNKIRRLRQIVIKAEKEMENIKDTLQSNKKPFLMNEIRFTGNIHSRFEFEVPEELVAGKLKPSTFQLVGTRKGYQKFITLKLKEIEFEYEFLYDEAQKEIGNFNIYIFNCFFKRKLIWNSLLQRISLLDAIFGLTKTSLFSGLEFTRPEISTSNKKRLEFKGLFHPVIKTKLENFVNNDVTCHENQNIIIITGPNMGGKSTLLRQICIAVIMGQIGCYIPAFSGKFSIIDRIFTRIGAKDDLLQGKSTFYVEMEETKIILEQCTDNSLIIIDELGRGTSTEDGQIIAKATINALMKKNNPFVLFTTHYHEIINWCQKKDKTKLYFMDCLVNDDSKRINFLYKFKEGVCPESYGLHVGRLAGLSNSVLELAEKYKLEMK